MTYDEYLLKCASVANVLAKIASGAYVAPEERAKAFKESIELFDYEMSHKVKRN